MNRYPYRLPLSLTSLGLSPSGEHLYSVSTERYSEWQGTVRRTAPRWKVALQQPAEAYSPAERYWEIYRSTPEKYLRTLAAPELPSPI